MNEPISIKTQMPWSTDLLENRYVLVKQSHRSDLIEVDETLQQQQKLLDQPTERFISNAVELQKTNACNIFVNR